MTENGMVLNFSRARYVLAIINSFQQLKKVIIATVIKAGLHIGATILERIVGKPAPSIYAASSIERGKLTTTPEKINVLIERAQAS